MFTSLDLSHRFVVSSLVLNHVLLFLCLSLSISWFFSVSLPMHCPRISPLGAILLLLLVGDNGHLGKVGGYGLTGYKREHRSVY